jgi:predicted nuclease of predicted toxin-antitoxin system
MRFLADECIDAAIVGRLRAAGHDVRYVAESDAAADDDAVLRLAVDEARILLTEDKDFGEIVLRSLPATGVILLRIGSGNRDLKWSAAASRLSGSAKNSRPVTLSWSRADFAFAL